VLRTLAFPVIVKGFVKLSFFPLLVDQL
jgi:hypothetical protein